MMENRKKVGILIIIAALLLLAIILIMFFKKTKPSIDASPTATTTNSGNLSATDNLPIEPASSDDVPRNYQSYDITKEAPHKLNANDASKLSALFTERLGSFSNESDYGNVTDLKIYMTATMQDWADKYITDLRSQKYSGQYYGITTKALTTKVLNYDEKAGKAKVEVATTRREDQADVLGVSYFQKMTLDLIRVNNEWLVDGAYWEKK